jgi:hypothetical protein
MVRRLFLLTRPAGRKWGSRQSVQPAKARSTDPSEAAMETASLGKLLRDGVSDAMVRAVRLVAARCGLAGGSDGNNACKSVSSLIAALRENDVVVRPEPPEFRLALAVTCRL